MWKHLRKQLSLCSYIYTPISSFPPPSTLVLKLIPLPPQENLGRIETGSGLFVLKQIPQIPK